MLEADSFATRLDTAIEGQDLTLGRIAARLEAAGAPVSTSTLSLWRSGRVSPRRKRSMKVVEALEPILGVEKGHLTSCVEDEMTTHDGAPERVSGIRAWPFPQEVRERLLAELGDDLPPVSQVIGRHETLMLDDEGRVISTHANITIRITHDDARRMVIGLMTSSRNDDGWVLLMPEVHFGGTLGKVVTDPELGLVVFELLFDEQLHAGDVTTLDYTVAPESLDWDVEGPDGEHSLHATTPLGHAILEARFHPDKLPIRVLAHFDDPNREDVQEQIVEVGLQGDGVVVGIDDLQRGRVKLHWVWED